MGLLNSGHSKLLELGCSSFYLTFTGDSENKKSINLNKNTPADCIINLAYDEIIIVKTICSDGQLVENNSPIMKPSFYANGSYQLILELKGEEDYELFNIRVNLNSRFQKIGKCYLGVVDFSADIGLSNFLITKDGKM
ncbi:hypothetical protein [Clostridium gasigenes]|uniref:hypothetical protein n=1 Tax=Clostridium gasigenes TaxID=94869 RepID=UPI001C0B7CBD|nr:hypothetical protein [Clostridium gasigenes]MBU3105833.1 hypothetical protein [Clostridium gasigenes]